MKKLSYPQRLMSVFASSKVFWGIVAVLIVQATWIALSGRYPMAFDEDFHLGIIRLYAHHLSPFWASQPANADIYGAVAWDPSYLFQYLMSFPYRLISVFSQDQTIQVLVLRFIDIGLFASCLPLYRRLLLKTGASPALVQLCFLLFVLVPVVPLMAAQINYDNLLLPMVAATLLLTVRISDELRSRQRIDVAATMLLLSLSLLACLVKYAFLPIFVAIVIYLTVRCKQTYASWRTFWLNVPRAIERLSRRTRLIMGLLLLLSCLLFGERYGINVIRFHTPIPSCDKILSTEACSDYGPWIRDHDLSIAKVNAPRSPLTFSADWFYGMWLRTFFAVDGPATQFQTRGPLLLPAVVAMVLPAIAVIATFFSGRRILKRYDATVMGLCAVVIVCYVGALWLDEYRGFLRTGQPVAINGRYLIPVLLPAILLGGLATADLLRRSRGAKLILASLAVVGLLWGGGALTYILRSNNDWYWPNQTVRSFNQEVQKTVGPIVPGNYSQTQFLH